MKKELRILIRTIFLVQNLAGSKISYPALRDAPESIKEVFFILGELIQNRNNTNIFNIEAVSDKVDYLVFREDISDTLTKWAKEIETFAVPTEIEHFPYEYQEFENIYDAIFFSELELLAKEFFEKEPKLAKMVILLSMILLGYSVGVVSFAQKAAFLLGLKDIFKSVASDSIPSPHSLLQEDVLGLFEPETAAFLHKTLTAAGGVAQAVEKEDLEGGPPTRLNLLQHEGYKKKKKKAITPVDKEELRNLLTKG